MKSIRELQYDNIMVSYINLLRLYSETPSMNTIEKIVSNIEYSTDRLPLCGNYRVIPYEPINDKYLNTEFELIRTDSNTIVSFLTQVEDYLRTIEFVSDIWSQYAKSIINSAREGMFEYTSDVISSNTILLNLQENIDKDNSTMVIQNGVVTPQQTTSTATSPIFVDQDISVKPTSTKSVNTITGSRTSILNASEYGNLILEAQMDDIEECGFILDIEKSIKNINSLNLEFISNTKGIRVVVEISTDGRTYKEVFNKVSWDTSVPISIGKTTDITGAKITITSNVPTYISDTNVTFCFKLKKVSFLNIKNSISNIFQTKLIKLDSDVKEVSAVVDAEIENANMVVRLSTDQNQNNEAVGFISVATLPNGILSLDLKNSNISISPKTNTGDSSDIWSLVPDSNYSVTLYNLFETFKVENVNNNDYTINADGKIEFIGDEFTLIPNSIKLYRGVKDYLKTPLEVVADHTVSGILYSTEYIPSTKWFKSLDLKIVRKEVVTPEQISSSLTGTNDRILVPYLVTNLDQVRLFKEDGTELSVFVKQIIPVTSSSGGVTITTYNIEFINPGGDLLGKVSNYTIEYITTVADYVSKSNTDIEIDKSSFNVSIGTTIMSLGSDYTFNEELWKLSLVKTGAYSEYTDVDTTDIANIANNSPDIVIGFKYKSKSNYTAYKYSTYVYCSSPTDIIIKPFNSVEISAGNYHRINGEDVSSLSTYTLNVGENYIETTQPYSSYNIYDLNYLTQNTSAAGIIIPDNIDSMYAFKDSLKLVSHFVLGTLSPSDASKCFAFDNNKLLISFQPDFVDPLSFSDETQSGLQGQLFTCKKPVYTSTYALSSFLPQPEILEMEFAYRSGEDKYLCIQISVECDSPDAYVNIKQLGINTLREG